MILGIGFPWLEMFLSLPRFKKVAA
jgi:hypothetical protein